MKAGLAERKLTADGNPVVVYLRADDAGFDFEAGVPVVARPRPRTPRPTAGSAIRKTPSGRAVRFTHRGAFDTMDRTYDAMTNVLDEKRLDVTEVYVEEYLTDPLTTPAGSASGVHLCFSEVMETAAARIEDRSRGDVETDAIGEIRRSRRRFVVDAPKVSASNRDFWRVYCRRV